MALLRWDEEEEKKEDGFSAPTPIISVDSVQSSWQSTQATDDSGNAQQPQNDNYLMSEEKAQVDNQLQQQRAAEAAEAARRAEMARQAAIARQNDAINRQNAANAQAAAQAQAQAQAQARNQARSAAKYQGGDRKRNEGGVTGFFKDVGAGIQQGLSALGDIALQGGSLVGSIGKKDQELVRHMDNSQKVREWLYGFKDINGDNFRGTSGADAAAGRIASGQGDIKDFAKVGGTGLQAGIDATMFMNPARLATVGLKPVTTQSVSLLSRTARSPAVRFALRDAAFFGSLQGTATFQTAYAESGGNLEAAVEAALTDAVIGGALQGTMDLAGSGIKVGANRTFNSLRRPSRTPPGSPIDEAKVTPVINERSDGNVSFEQGDIRRDTPPVADGIVTPVAPGAPDAPQYTPVADNLAPVRGEPVTPEPLTEAPDQLNGQTPPDWDEVTAREVAAVREQETATPAPTPEVADGTVQPPTIAQPVDNMPTVRSEEVRALQEARAGTDQAEEAVINQRLQELKDNDVYYHGTNQRIDEFNEGHLRPTFLTKDKEYANQYSYDRFNGREGGEAVGSVKSVDFKPAKTLDTARDATARALYNDEFLPYIKKFGDDEGVYSPLSEGDKVPYRAADDFYRFMRGKARRGETDYDAISVRELGDEPDSLIPMNPSRAKIRPEVEDTLTDARAPRESEIADNAQIRELDNSLGTIRQRREQMIADGRSENYHGVKQLDKAANDIIREQAKIANGIRRGDVLADSAPKKDSTAKTEWERQRNEALEMTEQVAESLASGTRVRLGRRVVGTSFAKAYKQNAEALRNASPNKAYEIDPKTGKAREHESSEILAAFSRSIGEDLPPIVIGNTPKQGAGRRMDTNTAGANATYSPSFSRLDYKEKRSVYHETVHHIDHFIHGYKGKNPKMLELQQLRKEITPEEVRKYKKVDESADNVYEYVAHAMDVLLDGRLKKGELGAGVLKYVKAFFTEVKEALSSAHVYGRKGIETVKYIKELDRAIHEIDVSKLPKQKPLTPKELTPTTSNLPPKMTPAGSSPTTPGVPKKPKKTVTPEQQSINDFAKRVFSNTDLHKDFTRRLARALKLEKDTESSVAELLSKTSVKVSGRDKGIIQKKFDQLENITNEYNAIMKQQRKGYQKDKTTGLDPAAAKRANQLIDTYGRIERDLNGYVRKIQGRSSIGNRIANIAENLTGARNASILSSVGGVSRNISQELGANILETVLHPIRMARGTVHMPAEIGRAYKRAAKEYTVKPKTVSEVFPYAIGNTYRLIMSPVTGIANVRKGVARDALAESLLRAQGETPTRAEIKKFAGSMGADSEVVANNLMGIMNGMTSHGKGLEVMRSYQEFVKTGSAAAKANFLANTERSSNLAAKMSQVASESNDPKVRVGVAMMNTVFPFVNTATNLAKTAATYNLSPVSRSINDEVLKAVRSNPKNVLAILKNKAATYGVLGGVYALYEADVIGYNDGEEIDKPRGIYIDMGGGNFHAVRATPIELPIAAVVTAAEIAKHASEGDMRPANYYAGIIGGSLPYVDSTTNLAAATGSAVNAYLGGDGTSGTDDNGYAAKAYGVNMAKSFVPYSNNGIIPAINSHSGKSTNAKSVYASKEVPDGKGGTKKVADIPKWFDNSMANSFGANPFTGTTRDSLKDNRDAAGRVRTVDQQGLWTGINKTINDKDTATHNKTINNLVTFARQNGLGKGTQDMFNTYDTGKNNNFKSVQDSITFLDVEDGGAPDNTKKLEQNEKLADLAAQISDGFWGESGSELLTLNGQNLYSDVSVPNADGTKNSRLPLNMQSIKNAIAATDLPKDQRDRMYEISQQNQELYSKVESKEWTYAQYKAVKAESEQEYVSILSNSESYKKLDTMMNALEEEGFFKEGGIGSTKSGQTYLWNSLNALLGSKGATPAAQYPKDDKGFTPWGKRGGGGSGKGFGATVKHGDRGSTGIKWTPVQARKMADAKSKKYTPLDIKVKLGNEVKKDKTQNYADRSF